MFAIDKFRMIERKRAAAAAKLAHANDNRHVERRTAVTPCRTALVGHWRKNEQNGRLEWHWSLEALSEELEAPLWSPSALRAGHTRAVLDATSGANALHCHPTDTQFDVVRWPAWPALIFIQN